MFRFVCTCDKLVTRTVVAAGSGDARPGSYDRVCLDYEREIRWFTLGCDELPC